MCIPPHTVWGHSDWEDNSGRGPMLLANDCSLVTYARPSRLRLAETRALLVSRVLQSL